MLEFVPVAETYVKAQLLLTNTQEPIMAKIEKTELKKSDILAAMKDAKTGDPRTDLTKEALMAQLAKKHDFIPEFGDYLFAMYQKAGKFEVGKDGIMVIKVQGQIRTTPRDLFTLTTKVEEVEVEYDDGTEGTEDQVVVVCEKSILNPGDKLPEGSSLSPVSAAKTAQKMAYAHYKEVVEALDVWAAEAKEAAAEEAKTAKAA